MPADAHLAAEHDVIVEVGAAGDADLGRQQHVAADGHAVADLHEVVDLGAGLDARFAHRRAIDGRVGAQLDVILDDDRGHLGNLLVRPIAPAHEAVAVAADDDAVLENHAIANRHALTHGHVGMDDAVGADARAGTDGDVGVDDRPIADCRPFPNRDKCADRYVRAKLRVGGQRRKAVDAGRGTPGRGKETDRASERKIRVLGAEHRARRGRRIVLEDHSRGARRAKRLLVFRVGEKRDVSRFGGLNARDAVDVDVPVTFQPTVEPLCEIAQFHFAENCNASWCVIMTVGAALDSWGPPSGGPIAYRIAATRHHAQRRVPSRQAHRHHHRRFYRPVRSASR